DENPEMVQYIVPKTTVSMSHMFQTEDPEILQLLATELDDTEALETLMLAIERGKEALTDIVQSSRQPNFLENAIVLRPEYVGVIEYLKRLGFSPGILYAAMTGDD